MGLVNLLKLADFVLPEKQDKKNLSMRNLILVVHVSLDGFVAGPNREFDGFEASEENLLFVCKLTETADSILMGRRSYELLEAGWPSMRDKPGASAGEIAYSNWYNAAKKVVVSKTNNSKNLHNTIVIGNDLAGDIGRIKEQPGRDILLFGSPSVAQRLFQLGLLDQCWVFVNPVLFGEGIPLFSQLSGKVKLTYLSAVPFANGELAIHYQINDSLPANVRSQYTN